jgi:hypothetical protein
MCPATSKDVESFVLFLLLLGEPPAGVPGGAGTATSAARAPAPESRTIVGEIVWVDVPTRLVLIRESVKTTKVKGQPAARQTVAVSVAPDVVVTRGKKVIPLENLKTKDHVTARYLATGEGAKALSFRVADTAPATPAAVSAADTGSTPAGGN